MRPTAWGTCGAGVGHVPDPAELYCAMLGRPVPNQTQLCHPVSFGTKPGPALPFCAMLCQTRFSSGIPSHSVPYYSIPCSAILCRATPGGRAAPSSPPQEFKRELYQCRVDVETLRQHQHQPGTGGTAKGDPAQGDPSQGDPPAALPDFRQRWDRLEEEIVSRQVRGGLRCGCCVGAAGSVLCGGCWVISWSEQPFPGAARAGGGAAGAGAVPAPAAGAAAVADAHG